MYVCIVKYAKVKYPYTTTTCMRIPSPKGLKTLVHGSQSRAT